MTVVVGTAGHIDHGKTTLLRALTGIDADRLPEERRRGMTIDVGYAHLDLDDGSSIDFVDVPGHDALIGNMLVGAGEIDAAMLVVAADDGPNAQTFEHLELLDALGIRDGIVVVTKLDLAGPGRAAEVAATVGELVVRTSLAGAPVLIASAATDEGIEGVRLALVRLRDTCLLRSVAEPEGPTRLAIDRAFVIKGRGSVVTGSLRGGPLRPGAALRLEPSGLEVRVRGLHVHDNPVDVAGPGRTALNVGGAALADLSRGGVLTLGPGIEVTDRILVALARPATLGGDRRTARPAWPPSDGAAARFHLGTAQVDAVIGRRGREIVVLPDGSMTAVLRLSRPVAVAVGDRAVLRRPSPGDLMAAVRVLDTDPARGISRRRADPERVAELARTIAERDVDAVADALVDLHGALPVHRISALASALGRGGGEAPPARPGGLVLSPDIRETLERGAVAEVAAHHRDHPVDTGAPLGTIRRGLQAQLRHAAAVRRSDAVAAEAAVDAVIADLVARQRLARDGDRLRDPAFAEGPGSALAAAMDRLVALLDVPSPPDLADAARAAGCPPAGVRALEASGRIVRVEANLAWASSTFQRLAAQALALARRGGVSPAALRDASGTSRRYVMPLLEDLDRRGILLRTPAGHVPGPRAPRDPGGAP